MSVRIILAALGLSAVGISAQAASVKPISYDMLNGDSGSYNYWDQSYTGSGNVNANGSSLTGGLGDLTDGVIATQNWNVVEAPAGNGPYVGWVHKNPVIDFRFASVEIFNSITFHFDDSDGIGGVYQPASANVNGTVYAVPTNAGSNPFGFTIDLAGLTTDVLTTEIARSSGWVFLSEVTFDAQVSAVPLPASSLLLMGGLAGLVGLRRRRKS